MDFYKFNNLANEMLWQKVVLHMGGKEYIGYLLPTNGEPSNHEKGNYSIAIHRDEHIPILTSKVTSMRAIQKKED